MAEVKAFIDKIETRHVIDENPDLSYLTDESRYEGEPAEEQAKYLKQDRERLEAYDRQEWWCVGVVAVAHVRLALDSHPAGTYALQTIESPGIWGVEDDSGVDYFNELEGEQVEELSEMLQALGFSAAAVKEARAK